MRLINVRNYYYHYLDRTIHRLFYFVRIESVHIFSLLYVSMYCLFSRLIAVWLADSVIMAGLISRFVSVISSSDFC